MRLMASPGILIKPLPLLAEPQLPLLVEPQSTLRRQASEQALFLNTNHDGSYPFILIKIILYVKKVLAAKLSRS